MSATDDTPSAPHPARFAETRWTMVLSARDPDAPHATRALEELCRIYWPPLYAFARRQGLGVHDAQDNTQAFFARLLEKEILRSVDREKGHFRTFLLVAFKRFLINVREHARAQRRGGGQAVLSIDADDAETHYRAEGHDNASADVVYERRWALTLLDQTLARLRAEYAQANKTRQFELMKGFLTDASSDGYQAVAAALGVSPGAARVAVHRLRSRYREIFRDEIAQTVADPSEIDAEISYLLSKISGGGCDFA